MRTSPPDRVEFAALGHRCGAVRATPALVRWLRGCWESGATPADAEGCGIYVLCRSKAPWKAPFPHAESQTITVNGVALTWLRHGERWWSTRIGNAGVEFELLDDRARIHVWGGGGGDLGDGLGIDDEDENAECPSSLLLALHVAMCEALRSKGLVPLNAAAIVRDHRATAVIGCDEPATALALASARDAGWEQLADDVTWLDSATRQLHGLRERDGRSASAALTRVVVLQRDASREARLAPLDPRDAARLLAEIAGVPLCGRSAHAFAAEIPGLVSDLDWVRSTIGRGHVVL